MGVPVKAVRFRDSAHEDLRAFPATARREAGYQLDKVQRDLNLTDWKPMVTVGRDVRENRIRDASGAFRDLYVAGFPDAIEDTPAEAENMKLRSTLMVALEEHIRSQGWTQTEAAHRLGVTQPRISDLFRGKIHLFSIDTLVNMAAVAGLHVEMRIAKAA